MVWARACVVRGRVRERLAGGAPPARKSAALRLRLAGASMGAVPALEGAELRGARLAVRTSLLLLAAAVLRAGGGVWVLGGHVGCGRLGIPWRGVLAGARARLAAAVPPRARHAATAWPCKAASLRTWGTG